VRSHAKASTAGSTQRQARGLGRVLREGRATRDAIAGADGRGVSAIGRFGPVIALLAALLLAVGAASASAAAPAISSTSVAAVTTTTAVLKAEINPEGEATTYRFEYGLADCSSNACTSIPVPDGNVGSGSTVVKISREVGGLQSDAKYHFRVVATNGSGPAVGPDRTFTTYAIPSDSSDCPNQEFRVGPAANLPDCRAYEMVSPVDKNGGEIRTLCNWSCWRTGLSQSAVDGDKITFASHLAFGDSASSPWSPQYIATRGSSGWSTHGISPPNAGPGVQTFTGWLFNYTFEDEFHAFTPDLSEAVLLNPNRVFAPGAKEGLLNAYTRDNTNDTYTALTTTEPAVVNEEESSLELTVGGYTPDGQHTLLTSEGKLTPDAAGGGKFQVYEASGGQLHLVSILPSGQANPNSSWAGGSGVALPALNEYVQHGMVMLDHAISDDGSRVFWTSNDDGFFDGALYVRKNAEAAQSALNGSNECTEAAKACTLPVSLDSHARFWGASADGSKALFTAGQMGSGEVSLALFDVDSGATTPIAGKVVGVAGAADDLSRFYFVSRESLAAGATAGGQNLYLYEEGELTFVAALSTGDIGQEGEHAVINLVSPFPRDRTSKVSPDGSRLAFMSNQSLTGYDNTDQVSGKADFEVFVFDAGTKQLTCVSCNPSGARPVGGHYERPYSVGDIFSGVSVAAWLNTSWTGLYEPRAISDDGSRLFFNSFDPLVPYDTNGQQDVYEWEAQGSGDCQKAGGCISLISTGQGTQKSEFVDASADGRDVFIETISGIDPRDTYGIDIYDARAGGGYPPPPAPPTPCEGDSCQSIPAAPNDQTPASANFRGNGDPKPRAARRICKPRKRAGRKGTQRKAQRAPRVGRGKHCRPAKRRAGR